jgi:hypothetical protein
MKILKWNGQYHCYFNGLFYRFANYFSLLDLRFKISGTTGKQHGLQLQIVGVNNFMEHHF